MRATLRKMRSMDPQGDSVNQRFSALIHRLATRAGYDLRPGAGGRQLLAERTGVHVSTVGRMLEGRMLPAPKHMKGLAEALNVDVLDLLVEAGIISPDDRAKTPNADVLSATSPTQPLSPEAAADSWGITHPMIRKMLIAHINEAIRLQTEADHRPDTASTGGP